MVKKISASRVVASDAEEQDDCCQLQAVVLLERIVIKKEPEDNSCSLRPSKGKRGKKNIPASEDGERQSAGSNQKQEQQNGNEEAEDKRKYTTSSDEEPKKSKKSKIGQSIAAENIKPPSAGIRNTTMVVGKDDGVVANTEASLYDNACENVSVMANVQASNETFILPSPGICNSTMVIDQPTAAAAAEAMRTTRSMKKQQQQEEVATSPLPPPPSKTLTPKPRTLPIYKVLSEQRIGRPPPPATNDNKYNSAMKPSRAEAVTEEKRRKQVRNDEALQKKIEKLQAKAEEQRRQREEKMLRVQTAREAMEREKEEKIRQQIADKEEKRLEELKKQRAQAAQKQAEAEERREQVRIAKQREIELAQKRQQEQQRQLLEMQKKFAANNKNKPSPPPPLLPHETYTGSDSDEDSPPARVVTPSWARNPQVETSLRVMSKVPRSVVESLFDVRPTTPDLRDIFHNIDDRLLHRNSSAMWRTPPTLPKY